LTAIDRYWQFDGLAIKHIILYFYGWLSTFLYWREPNTRVETSVFKILIYVLLHEYLVLTHIDISLYYPYWIYILYYNNILCLIVNFMCRYIYESRLKSFEPQHENSITQNHSGLLQSYILQETVKIVVILDAEVVVWCQYFCKNGKNRISTIAIIKIYELRFELTTHRIHQIWSLTTFSCFLGFKVHRYLAKHVRYEALKS